MKCQLKLIKNSKLNHPLDNKTIFGLLANSALLIDTHVVVLPETPEGNVTRTNRIKSIDQVEFDPEASSLRSAKFTFTTTSGSQYELVVADFGVVTKEPQSITNNKQFDNIRF